MIKTQNLEINDKNLDEVKRQLCQLDLRYLCTRVLGFTDWDVCHDELDQWYRLNEDKKFKLVLLPRGHLKSSIITVARTVQDILKNPNAKILLSSAVWQNSRTFLSQIKEYLRPNTPLSALFGEFSRPDGGWTTENITIAQRTIPDKSATIATAGVEKTVTSQHFDIIRADDLVSRENITTPEQLKKVVDHFRDLAKLLEPNGTIEIIGTRWHDADLYGYIIENLCDDRSGDRKFAVYKRTAVENGKPIFPKKFTLETLAAIRHEIGSFDYSANYDNDPIDPENQMFRPPVRYWTSIPENIMRIITVDPAGDSADSDFNVVSEIGFSKANQLYVMRYKRGHVQPNELLDWIFEFVGNKQGLLGVGVESIQYQRVLQYLIGIEQKKRGVIFPVYPIIPHKDKFTRLRQLQPWWERGDLLLKPGMVELEDEFERFPVSAHDDIMDTVEMGLHLFQGYMHREAAPDPRAELKSTPASYDEWTKLDKRILRPRSTTLSARSVLSM